MSESQQVDNAIAEKLRKKEEENQRILQLKQRLAALKLDTSEERNRQQLEELKKKCESIMALTQRLIDSAEERVIKETEELQELKLSVQQLSVNSSAVESLKEENMLLKQQLESLPRNENTPDTSNDLEVLLDNEREKNKELQEEITKLKQRLESSSNEKKIEDSSFLSSDSNDSLRISGDSRNNTIDEKDELWLRTQNEKLLSQIKHLQCTFENEEALARALYINIGAETLPNPNRCGYLTKQGGTVKSWKRRYFVLKDNFLLYYKKPKDDNPTGVIQLEGAKAYESTTADELDRKNCFFIKTQTRNWLLQADRQIEMDIWIDCISNMEPWWAKDTNKDDLRIAKEQITTRKKKGSFRISMYLNSHAAIKKD